MRAITNEKNLSFEELMEKYGKLSFENDYTQIDITKIENGYNVLNGGTGCNVDTNTDDLDEILDVVQNVKSTYDILEDWSDDYLDSIEDYEFKVTSNCINLIHLAKLIHHGGYSWKNHNEHCTDVRVRATDVIDEYYSYIDELLGEL